MRFHDSSYPSSSLAKDFGRLDWFDGKPTWDNVESFFPYTFDKVPAHILLQASISGAMQHLNSRSVAMRCLMQDQISSLAEPVYEANGWVAHTTVGKTRFKCSNKNGQCHVGLSPITTLPPGTRVDKDGNISAIWSSGKRHRMLDAALERLDGTFFVMLDSLSASSGNILEPKMPFGINTINQAFKYIEDHDCVVNHVVVGTKVAGTMSSWAVMGGAEQLIQPWWKAEMVMLPHLWTADVLVTPLCPPGRIYCLSEPPFVGAIPIKGGEIGMAILQPLFSVLDVGNV